MQQQIKPHFSNDCFLCCFICYPVLWKLKHFEKNIIFLDKNYRNITHEKSTYFHMIICISRQSTVIKWTKNCKRYFKHKRFFCHVQVAAEMWRPWVFSRWLQLRSLPFRSASALAARETLFPTPSTVGMTASSDMLQLPWRLSPQMEKTPNRKRRASPNNRKRPPINHHKRYSKVPENVGGKWIYVQCFYNTSIGVTFNQIVANLGAR